LFVGSLPSPVCPVCSKSIRSGTLVLYELGDLFHVSCRSRTLELAAMEEVDRARATQARSARVLEDAERSRTRRQSSLPMRGPSKSSLCPICRQPATITDWRPSVDWLAIEGCSCHGYFLWAGMDGALETLTEGDRMELAARIRKCRAMGYEAWCATVDGTTDGPVVVRTERPDRRP
jgi:hypothetical protein